MLLSILERVVILQILPAEASYVDFKIISDLKTALSFSENEIKECNIVESDGMVRWGGSVDKDVEIGDRAKAIISEALVRLDGQKKINASNYAVYERFVNN